MTLDELRVKEKIARKNLDVISAMVQEQGRLDRDDPLKFTYDQMTVLYDRLDAAREAWHIAYDAYDVVYMAS